MRVCTPCSLVHVFIWSRRATRDTLIPNVWDRSRREGQLGWVTGAALTLLKLQSRFGDKTSQTSSDMSPIAPKARP